MKKERFSGIGGKNIIRNGVGIMQNKIIKSVTKEVDSIEFYELDKWSKENLYKTENKLFVIKQDDDNCLIIDSQQILGLKNLLNKIVEERTIRG